MIFKCGNFFLKFHIFYLWNREDTNIKDLMINEQIQDSEVRLLSATGEQLGIVSLEKAMQMASDEDLDLVKISPNATPPVCKLMNYGKFKFEQQKKEKEAKFKQRQNLVELKTIRIGLNISDHDLEYRAKQALDFVKNGDKVKANMMLKGRQQAYVNNGIEILTKFAGLVGDGVSIEKAPYQEGRYVNMILAPKK